MVHTKKSISINSTILKNVGDAKADTYLYAFPPDTHKISLLNHIPAYLLLEEGTEQQSFGKQGTQKVKSIFSPGVPKTWKVSFVDNSSRTHCLNTVQSPSPAALLQKGNLAWSSFAAGRIQAIVRA